MTGTLQFLNPRRDTWAGGPQRIFVSRSNKKTRWGAGFSASGPWSRDTPSRDVVDVADLNLGITRANVVFLLRGRRSGNEDRKRERRRCKQAVFSGFHLHLPGEHAAGVIASW
jgi:hypothetical protein